MIKYINAFIATGLVVLLNFMSGVLIARLLGPTGRGEVSEIIAWFSFISSLSIIGINDSVTYFRSNNTATSSEVMTSALSLLGISIPLGTLIALFPLFFAFQNIENPILWVCLIIFIPLNQMSSIFMSYLQSSRNVLSFNIARTLPGIIYVSMLTILGLVGAASTFTVICANLAGFAMSLGFGLLTFRMSGDGLSNPRRHLRRSMLKYGSPLVMQRLAGVCRDNLDKMVLPAFISTAVFGQYVVASSVAYLIFIVGMTIELVGFPALVRAGSDEERRKMAETLIALTFWMLVVAGFGLIALRYPVVHFIFGSRYDSSSSLVPGFVLAGALQALRLVVGTAFKGFGRSKTLAGIEFVGAFITIAVLFGGAPWLGAMAGVLAHVISSMVAGVVAIVLAVNVLGLSPIRLIVPHREALLKILGSIPLKWIGRAH